MIVNNFSYTAARNPKWSNSAHTAIDIEVNFDHLDFEYVPFTADPNDLGEAHSVEIYNRAVAGDFGTIAAYEPQPDITGAAAMEALRSERNFRLSNSDWMVASDRTASSDQLTYRQALRDLPANNPNAYLTWDEPSLDYVWANVSWPTLSSA